MGHSANTSGLRSVIFNYTGREAPSLKMGFFFFSPSFWFADFALWTLIGSRPDGTFFACEGKYSGAVEEQDVDDRCMLCLPSLAL